MKVDREPAERRPGRTLALVAAVVELAFAIGLGLLRDHNASVGEHHAEGLLPTLALTALFAAPGILALVGVLIDRPVLWGVAAAGCVPVAIISIAAFPILLPAGGLLIAFIQSTSARQTSVAPSAVLTIFVIFVGLVIVALGILLGGKGTYSYSYAGGAEGGEYYLPTSAAIALAVVTVALTLTTAIAVKFARS